MAQFRQHFLVQFTVCQLYKDSNNKQIFHAFLFNMRNHSPEVIDIQRRGAELSIILPRANNFDIKQRKHGIFVSLYGINTKQDVGK